MPEDKQQPEKQEQQENALQQVNLDDYAGDEEDNRIATERADRYMEDLDRAADQKSSGAPPQQEGS